MCEKSNAVTNKNATNDKLQVLVNVPARVFYEIIGRGEVGEGHVAWVTVEYYMSFENFPEPNNFRRILAPVH